MAEQVATGWKRAPTLLVLVVAGEPRATLTPVLAAVLPESF